MSPLCEGAEPDVENAQVLGFADGETTEEAERRFWEENGWAREMGFSEVRGMELK